MGCGHGYGRLAIASDLRFESEADGLPAIHWLDETTWAALGGCRALLNYLTVLGLEGTAPSVAIVARGSADGKTWSEIDGLQSDPINVASATAKVVMLVPKYVTPLPPLMQLGLKVQGSAGQQAAARVTWSVDPRHCTGTPALARSGSATNPTTGYLLTGAFDGDLLGELDVAFGVGITTAAATTVDLETSADLVAWFRAASVSLSAANDSGAARATNLLRYVRLVVRSTATTNVAWSFRALVP